ncbi:hypothetical protein NE237_023571 [Protea cynaroides]|uniref:Uncharacterized protein n=1 Tax=Protea cynaroides TaxID=273540 RepID=A0A9Q0K5I8_9MAGN|nr:hypothetical protein NE237_023571 [Protea cynaroides]
MRRKYDSEEGMPFSWEKKPGISKLNPTTTRAHQKHNWPTHSKMEIGRPVSSSSCDPATATASTNKKVCEEQQEPLKLPPPPGLLQPPHQGSSNRRTSFVRGLGSLGVRRQQDPFLAAYKECTKSVRNGDCTSSSNPDNSKYSMINNGENGNRKHDIRGSGTSLFRKTAFLSSCKHSCEVRDDSFIKLPLPPPPPSSKQSNHGYTKN